MKIVISLILSASIFINGCYSAARQRADDDRWAREHGYEVRDRTNPCNDPRFLALQRKPIDSLSIREYDFLRTMEDRCAKYDSQKAEELKEENTTSPFTVGFLITLGVVAAYALIHFVL